MVTPAIALPNLLTPVPPAQAAVLTAASPDPALGRLPLFSVPGPIAPPEAQNNTRGGGGAAFARPAFPAEEFPAAPLSPGYPAARPAPASGPSSAFLAQLFGQGGANGRLAADFFVSPERLNIFDAATLARFRHVKYLPSEAAKPRFDTPPTQPLVEVRRAAPPTVQSEVQRISDARRQDARQEIAVPSGGSHAAAAAQQPAGTRPPARGGASRAKPRDSSAEPLHAQQGAEAYLATLSRNAANLSGPPASSAGPIGTVA